MKRTKKYIRLNDTSKTKREQDLHFAKKRTVEEKNLKREDKRRDGAKTSLIEETGTSTASFIWTILEKTSHILKQLSLRY